MIVDRAIEFGWSTNYQELALIQFTQRIALQHEKGYLYSAAFLAYSSASAF